MLGTDSRRGIGQLLSLFLSALLTAMVFVACGEEIGGEADDTAAPAQADDNDDGNVASVHFSDTPDVIWQVVDLPGTPAPPNPVKGIGTPDEFNRIRYHRLRYDSGDQPPKEVSAVVILLAGFTVGPGTLVYLGRHWVQMSEGRVEVWLPERRAHFLEDNLGLDAAQAANNPYIASGYYFEGKPIDGQTFAGFVNAFNDESAMTSEWSMDLMMHDLRRIVQQVPQGHRATNVFMGGHSRGVPFARTFAAYEFEDGRLGCDDLAGLVLIDGDGRFYEDYGEEDFLQNLDRLRRGKIPRFVPVPPLGPNIYVGLEIMAMAASDEMRNTYDDTLGPDGIFDPPGLARFLKPMMFRFQKIRMTNEAFMGLSSDEESGQVDLLHGHFGKLDGPVAEDDAGVYPTSKTHLYQWLNYDEVYPREASDIQDTLHGLWQGPTNGFDPYYPSRLSMDQKVAGHLETAGTWREKYFKLRTSKMDAPVFVLQTQALAGLGLTEQYEAQLPPARGQTKSRSEYGYDVMTRLDWSHVDAINAAAPGNPFFEAVVNWVQDVAEGTVRVP